MMNGDEGIKFGSHMKGKEGFKKVGEDGFNVLACLDE